MDLPISGDAFACVIDVLPFSSAGCAQDFCTNSRGMENHLALCKNPTRTLCCYPARQPSLLVTCKVLMTRERATNTLPFSVCKTKGACCSLACDAHPRRIDLCRIKDTEFFSFRGG